MLLIPLYILSVGLAAGVVGVFARHLLAAQGYVPDFTAGVMLATGVAAVYGAVQLGYIALLRVVKPTHSGVPLLAECFSNAGALLLAPVLLPIEIPWPHPALNKVEDFILLGLFVAAHGAFKLLSLFGATQGKASERFGGLVWVSGAAGLALVATGALQQWHVALGASHDAALTATETVRHDGAQVQARRLAEGGFSPIDLRRRAGRDMLLGWMPGNGFERRPDTLYLIFRPEGNGAKAFQEEVQLAADGWTWHRVAADRLPKGATSCQIMWSTEKQPLWVTEMGLRPAEESTRDMLLWGPRFPAPPSAENTPGVILVLVEGLGAEHVAGLGYKRATTPSLDALAEQAMLFTNVYTPTPEGPGATMSVLTGNDPLVHGYLGGRRGTLPPGTSLPEAFQLRDYLTAAFTEGAEPGSPNLAHGSGAERGFDWFDHTYPMEKAARRNRPGATGDRPHGGSWRTLSRAAAWIEQHHDAPFFVCVRLTELRTVVQRGRYGRGYVGHQVDPPPLDMYDNGLRYVDAQLGRFLERLKEIPGRDDWCVAVAGTHGLDFLEPGRATWRKGGPGVARLSESSLHVPVWLQAPGGGSGREDAEMTLTGLTAALAEVARLENAGPRNAPNLLDARSGELIAVTGNPLQVSLRARRWLFTWNTGLDATTFSQVRPADTGDMFDVYRYRENLAQLSGARGGGDLARLYRERLEEYLKGVLGLEQPIDVSLEDPGP